MKKNFEPITKENRAKRDPYNIYPDGYIPFSHPRWNEIPKAIHVSYDKSVENRTFEEALAIRKYHLTALDFTEEENRKAIDQLVEEYREKNALPDDFEEKKADLYDLTKGLYKFDE